MTGPLGVWVTFEGAYDNAEDVHIFRSEIAALRHALGTKYEVAFVHWGESISEAVSRRVAESA